VYRLRRRHPDGRRRQCLRGYSQLHAPRVRPHHRGQGERAGIVDNHAGPPQRGRRPRPASRARRRAIDRDGRRPRPRPVLRRRHHHPPARTRPLYRPGGRVPPAGRGRAGFGIGLV
ncbi:MAG: hypothetical protein AVDCRST_MAG01-01-516, partial [uncultured Rubrobacteraceae bacterium]